MSLQQRIYDTALASLVLTGLMAGPVFAYQGDSGKPSDRNDLGAILEKLPPETRDRIRQEFERIREDANRMRREALEQGERVKAEAGDKARQLRREAEAQLERMRDELNQQREFAEANRQKDQPKVERRPDEPQVSVSREVRVEVRKDGDSKPQIQIFKDGKPVSAGEFQFEVNADHLNHDAQQMDLSKLPPEKREVIEKARAELKEAEARLRKAAENLAKAEGREKGSVMIFRADGPAGAVFMGKPGADGMPEIQLRGIPGDRLPRMVLPPRAMGDRMPRPPVGTPGPELKNEFPKQKRHWTRFSTSSKNFARNQTMTTTMMMMMTTRIIMKKRKTKSVVDPTLF